MVSRPARLRVGDQVIYRGRSYAVSMLSPTTAGLTAPGGATETVPLRELFAEANRVGLWTRRTAPLPARGVLEGLPADVVEKAEWWERHLVEVLIGVAPDAGGAPRAEYDPLATTLRQREIGKVAELAAAGHRVPLSTLQRMRRHYQAHGLLGLVDGRITRTASTRVDERVSAAIRKAVTGETDRSTGTVTRLRRRVEQILASDYDLDPATVMPPRSSFYRLVERIAAGRHTFGSAATRRSLAQRPAGPFGSQPALRPGEWMPIDSTPLDVRVVLDDGTVDRAELTMMIDVATRSIPAAVLRPTTKAVDAALLLARAITPEPMRPGWADALRMARSVLPHQRLVTLDERLEHAAARPVIVPETVVCDHGNVYLSRTFRAACRAMGINFQPTHKGSPWEKGVVERTFGSIATLFAQYVAGYVGRSVDRRGRNADQDAVWSITELQDLLDEWIVAHWQNRAHDGLAHPLAPAKTLTPNEQYAALVETAGYVPVPLGGEDYIELLPATWRVINSYGIKISRRTYDCSALNPYRRQHSGVSSQNGRWEVHYDPYDVTRIWLRNHHEGGWITVAWTHLRSAPTPFGEQAWTQAQQILARRGHNPVTETEIAAAVSDLLDTAEHGPHEPIKPVKTRRDRRVAARTRATVGQSMGQSMPMNPPSTADTEPADTGDEQGDDDGLAPVVPLPIFDARAEAQKWW